MRDGQLPPVIPDVAGAVIVYDGECPICSAYVQFVRLRESVGSVKLVDARTDDEWVRLAGRLGLDLNEGMVLFLAGRAYHGADCMHMLAMLSAETGWMRQILGGVFRRRRLARILYPALRSGRNALLYLLGRRRIARAP